MKSTLLILMTKGAPKKQVQKFLGIMLHWKELRTVESSWGTNDVPDAIVDGALAWADCSSVWGLSQNIESEVEALRMDSWQPALGRWQTFVGCRAFAAQRPANSFTAKPRARASHGRIRRFGYRLRTTCKMITRRTDAGTLAIEHPDIPYPGFLQNHLLLSVYAMPRRE